MRLFKIALRNIFRNKRRSAMTGSAVAVATVAVLIFGAFISYMFAAFQTNVVQRAGHLTVFRTGYFLFGAGNPAAYGISDYRSVMKLIGDDPVLKQKIWVMTPSLALYGIAGNFSNDTSKTFVGIGVVPSDRERMRQWNEFGAGRPFVPDSKLSDDDSTRGTIGVGLARILGFCGQLKVPNCPVLPAAVKSPTKQMAALNDQFTDLLAQDVPPAEASRAGGMPTVDLLAATAGGAPNVVSLRLSGADPQSVKEFDDNYVGMHLGLAQQLLYGRGEHKITSIVLQLNHSDDMSVVRARLASLFKEHNLELEVRDFAELNPFYTQTRSFFGAVFLFIALIMGVIVLFTVVNTMSMTVMERTTEIGMTRALGVRRRSIRRQFITEGWMLGAIGATAGIAVAYVVATLVNNAGLSWTPPANVTPIPLKLFLFNRLTLVAATWIGLVLMATLAAFIPANRAAKLPVVDALRHV